MIPGLSANYLLTSSTISNAALPTDFNVNAENQYGIIAPINNPINTRGELMPKSVNGWLFNGFDALVINAPYNENATNAADPIANPLPIAAVQFPAASS